MVFPRSPEESMPQAPGDRRRRRRRRETSEDVQRLSDRRAQERRRQKIAIGIGVALIFVVLAIVGVGYYIEFFRPPRVLAGQVRDVKFSMGDLVDRIRVLQGINRYQGGRVDLSTVPFEYLQDMVHAEILRQASPGLGFSANDEDVDRELRRRFRPVPPEGQEVDEGQLDQEYDNALTTFLTSTKLSEDQYRRLVEEEILRNQLVVLIDTTLPDSVEQVEIEWIKVHQDSPADPLQIRERLRREDFGQVAAEVNTPDPFADPQGYVGWVPRDAFPELNDDLFGNPARNREQIPEGEISDPIFTQEGVYIIHEISGPQERKLVGYEDLLALDSEAVQDLTVEERDALGRELRMRSKLSQIRVEEWYEDQLSRGSDEGWLTIKFNSELYAWVADQVHLSAPRVQQPGRPAGGGPGFP